MAFCNNCGSPIDEKAVVCPHCGVQQKKLSTDEKDNGGFLWESLGCCFPLVGLILFLVWKDTKPKTAKAIGMGALISVAFCVLWYITIFLMVGIDAMF